MQNAKFWNCGQFQNLEISNWYIQTFITISVVILIVTIVYQDELGTYLINEVKNLNQTNVCNQFYFIQ